VLSVRVADTDDSHFCHRRQSPNLAICTDQLPLPGMFFTTRS
jgi:hypothetical protein